MGEGTEGEHRTTSELRSEIERRRNETTGIVYELEDRVNHALDIKHQIRSHPKVVAAIVAVPVVLAVGVGVMIAMRRRQDRSLGGQLRRGSRDLMDAFDTLKKSGITITVNAPEDKEPRSQRLVVRAATAAATAGAPILARKIVEGIAQRQMAMARGG